MNIHKDALGVFVQEETKQIKFVFLDKHTLLLVNDE